VVTAPRLADRTVSAYLAKTPQAIAEVAGRQRARLAASSASGTSRVIWRVATSMVIGSPSWTRPIGPPWAASGATWASMKPWVPPEKRPSVTSATWSDSPAPTMATVTCSISRMPGPPTGPSLRITTTSPGWIWPSLTAYTRRSVRA
jgi:hypothetical protein